MIVRAGLFYYSSMIRMHTRNIVQNETSGEVVRNGTILFFLKVIQNGQIGRRRGTGRRSGMLLGLVVMLIGCGVAILIGRTTNGVVGPRGRWRRGDHGIVARIAKVRAIRYVCITVSLRHGAGYCSRTIEKPKEPSPDYYGSTWYALGFPKICESADGETSETGFVVGTE
jgi:hypothetical protein